MCNKFHGIYAFFQSHSHAPVTPSLMFFTINSIHCFIYFLFLPPYYSTTFLSCSIFSSLHYFLFKLLTFLQYFLLFLSFGNMNFNIKGDSLSLFSGKTLASWPICDEFMICWGKSKGFGVIKDKVVKEGDTIRRRLYICKHGKKYTSKSNKNTSTKKMSCQWHVNASCPKRIIQILQFY